MMHNTRFPALLPVLLAAVLFTGCQNDYYTAEDFYSVEKIDAHVHINVDHPAIIEQAENDNMRIILLNVDNRRNPIELQRDVAVTLMERHPGRVAFATTFEVENWEDPERWQRETIEYLEDSFGRGAFGVKVWKNVGLELQDENGDFVMIDDPQFDPVIGYLEENGYPLFAHIGEPHNCWLPLDEMTTLNDRDYFANNPQFHMYLHPEYPSYEEIIESRNNRLDRHPDLTFFGAHLGSMEWSIEMMAEHLDRYPNMVLGMAHRVPHLQYLARQDREKLRDFMIEYQDRFLYSTDLMHFDHSDPEEVRELAENTWREDWEFFVTDNTMSVWQVEGEFQGLQLPRGVVDKIFRENARRWLPGTGF